MRMKFVFRKFGFYEDIEFNAVWISVGGIFKIVRTGLENLKSGQFSRIKTRLKNKNMTEE